MLDFVNDYSEGAHEKILQRLLETNMEKLSGYGTDQYCESAKQKIREACENISVTLAYEGGVQKVLLNGKDISDQIRQEEVGNMASATSGYGFVRAKLLSLQQDMAAQYDVIMDGRDIGTCVLPDAIVVLLPADFVQF